MKPRIEKKLSKALVAIFAGTRVFNDMWIDDSFERYPRSAWGDKPPLTPGQIRYNYECKQRVSHVPSIGGAYDSWAGDCADHCTVYEAYRSRVWGDLLYSNELCELDCRYPIPDEGTTEHAAWQAQKDALLEKARKAYRQCRPGNRLLALARLEAIPLRAEEATRRQRQADRAAEREARKQSQQIQPETQGTPA